jgi:hypothetical protein
VIIDQDDSRSSMAGLKAIVSSIDGLDKDRKIRVILEMFGAPREIEVSVERIAKIA